MEQQKVEFKNLTAAFQEFIHKELFTLIERWEQDRVNIEGQFLTLALKASNFSSINSFMQSGRKFYDAIPIINTYEGLVQLLSSIFCTNEIQITTEKPASINIVIINHNLSFLQVIQDKDRKAYVDYKPEKYLSFSAKGLQGVEEFFMMFLKPFIPAGVKLNKIDIKQEPVKIVKTGQRKRR